MASQNTYYHPANFKVSYVDFPPKCAGAGDVICAPIYERFDMLVERANEWLRANPMFRAKCCESIEVKGRLDGVLDTNRSSYFEADHTKRRMRNIFIRGLRLWVTPNDKGPDTVPQQIAYINVIPSRNGNGEFDQFKDIVRRFNVHVRQRPLPGRILNVESQEMKFHEWGLGVDPDESCWVESVKYNVSFLMVVRVFYEIGAPAFEELGCADFVPACTDPGSQIGGVAHFENFGDLVKKAGGWLRQNANIQVCNVQSVSYKLHKHQDLKNIDTQSSFFVESGRFTTRYIRILRVYFLRNFHEPEALMQNYDHIPRPLHLSYVTFEPVMLSQGGIVGIPVFEPLSDTMKRAIKWLNDTGQDARIISAETVAVRMFSGNQYGNHEVTYTWNRGEQKEIWLLVLRVYLDGQVHGDCSGIIPALIDAKRERDEDCCRIT